MVNSKEVKKNRIGVIYKYTSPSGKIYVGQTVSSMQYRWRRHISDIKHIGKENYQGCILLSYAIRKYGPDAFKKEILGTYPSEELDKYEIKFIKEHNALAPHGYNLRSGGGANHELSEELKHIVAVTTKKALELKGTELKRSAASEGLPLYLGYFKSKGKNDACKSQEGYRLRRHPLCPDKSFYANKYNSLENVKNIAIAFTENLNEQLEILRIEIN